MAGAPWGMGALSWIYWRCQVDSNPHTTYYYFSYTSVSIFCNLETQGGVFKLPIPLGWIILVPRTAENGCFTLTWGLQTQTGLTAKVTKMIDFLWSCSWSGRQRWETQKERQESADQTTDCKHSLEQSCRRQFSRSALSPGHGDDERHWRVLFLCLTWHCCVQTDQSDQSVQRHSALLSSAQQR